MCGICGYLANYDTTAGNGLLRRMVTALRHRGPDDQGVYLDGPAGLGHTRLSIIDAAGGAQPMQTPSGDLAISYNGEIFNYVELRQELLARGHRFETQSDTEVLLHLYQEYGEQCIVHVNGQWAFAIWDRVRQRLFLSRDRVGVRPLYYAQTSAGFHFASEVKALLHCTAVDFGLDAQAIDQIFTFWHALPPRTPFRGVQQLPPGHCMTVTSSGTRLWPYWRLELEPDAGLLSQPEHRVAEELLALLQDAVRLRLRSDVPVGTYLSGGLDSTLVTALAMREARQPTRSFSISFQEPGLDESEYQRQASQWLATQHTSIFCRHDDIAAAFPEVIRHCEQPVLRTAPAPLFLLSRTVRDSGYKVVLTGEGADESFGGYDLFKEVKIRLFCLRQSNSRFRPNLLRRLYPYWDTMQRQPTAYLARFFSISAPEQPLFYSHLPRWQSTRRLKTFYSENFRASLAGYEPMVELESQLPESYRRADPFLQAQYLESAYLLPGYILSSQGDRVAMAHSVEGRFPFLDHRVVQFAARLPIPLKMKVLREKHLLRLCASSLVPRSILERKKQPYRAPDGAAFLSPAAQPYLDALLDPACLQRYDVFEPRTVSALLAKFRRGVAASASDNMALVGIVSTQLFLSMFLDSSGQRSLPYGN